MQRFPFRDVPRFLWTFSAAFQVDELNSYSDQPITISLARPARVASRVQGLGQPCLEQQLNGVGSPAAHLRLDALARRGTSASPGVGFGMAQPSDRPCGDLFPSRWDFGWGVTPQLPCLLFL